MKKEKQGESGANDSTQNLSTTIEANPQQLQSQSQIQSTQDLKNEKEEINFFSLSTLNEEKEESKQQSTQPQPQPTHPQSTHPQSTHPQSTHPQSTQQLQSTQPNLAKTNNKAAIVEEEVLEVGEEVEEEIENFGEMVREAYLSETNKTIEFDEKEFEKIKDKKDQTKYLEKFARKFKWSEELKKSFFWIVDTAKQFWHKENKSSQKQLRVLYKKLLSFFKERHMNTNRFGELISTEKKKQKKKEQTVKQTKNKEGENEEDSQEEEKPKKRYKPLL